MLYLYKPCILQLHNVAMYTLYSLYGMYLYDIDV